MDGASDYPHVCRFPTHLNTEDMASAHGGFFGLANYAFFLPRQHHDVAEAWWRQHHNSLDYFVHTNTGCQDPDHTIWPTVSPWAGWNIRLVDKSGLVCCHTGPAGCRCDITHYINADGQPLLSQGLGKPMILGAQDLRHSMTPAVLESRQISANGFASVLTKGTTASGTRFRETVYNTSGDARGYSQIEDVGNENINIYECIATEGGSCQAGAVVITATCSKGDTLATRFSWLDDADSGGAGYRFRTGSLASDSCPGLCLTSTSSSTVVLGECGRGGSWGRYGTGNKDTPEQHAV